MTGLAEVAGSFTFNRTGRGANMTLVFAIKTSVRDRQLLEELQAFFGAGAIYDVRASDSALFKITKNDGLGAVVEHFASWPLRSSKSDAFETWREMVELKIASFRRPPMERLNELATRLAGARRR